MGRFAFFSKPAFSCPVARGVIGSGKLYLLFEPVGSSGGCGFLMKDGSFIISLAQRISGFGTSSSRCTTALLALCRLLRCSNRMDPNSKIRRLPVTLFAIAVIIRRLLLQLPDRRTFRCALVWGYNIFPEGLICFPANA